MMTIRPATPADLESIGGRLPYLRGYFHVGEVDGKIVGWGGYGVTPNGWAVMTLGQVDDGVRPYPVQLCRAVMKSLADARRRGFRTIVAECDDAIEGSRRLLEWLGFRDAGGYFVYGE